jgi:glycosyltransferase involved in cell wall biosynthesis
VLEELVTLFPGAPIYTSIYAAAQMPAHYRQWEIHTSFMQRLPAIATHHQPYMPLYPLAFQRMDLSGYDLVISNKSGFCHGVQGAGFDVSSAERGKGQEARGKRAAHICYCLTPTRFLWQLEQYSQRERFGNALNVVLRPLLQALQRWDWQAAQRVDHFVAISTAIQERIQRSYGRTSVVIYPPVDTDYFTPDVATPVGDYFLIVSRLIPYKRIDLAVQAFQHLPQEQLLIVGEGRDAAALQAQATANVTFLGHQPRERIRELLRGCKAFLFPGLEDFGIAPVEAMSSGRPVIAYGAGGALDTVVPGISGEWFAEQTVESLLGVLVYFNADAYDPAACRAQAEKFSTENFRRNFMAYVAAVMGTWL